MANNNLLASDNFASGSLAAGWSVLNFVTDVCAVIAGSPNVTEPKALTNGYGQQWTGLVWPLDHTSEVTVASLTSEVGTSITLLTRWQFASVSGYEAVISNGSAILKSFTNGTGTTLTTATGLTFAAGDVWSFQAAGSLLTLYRNGALIAQALDVSYLSWVGVGAPGYTETSTVNITHAQVSSWRGYSAVQQDGIWAKEGIPVGLAPTSTDITSGGEGVATTSQILFEGNAQILSGTVYKIWFCGQQPIASNRIARVQSHVRQVGDVGLAGHAAGHRGHVADRGQLFDATGEGGPENRLVDELLADADLTPGVEHGEPGRRARPARGAVDAARGNDHRVARGEGA